MFALEKYQNKVSSKQTVYMILERAVDTHYSPTMQCTIEMLLLTAGEKKVVSLMSNVAYIVSFPVSMVKCVHFFNTNC